MGRVIFYVAAGPRIGFGHLVRSRRLAEALAVRPIVALDGGAAARRTARKLGCEVVAGSRPNALAALRPSLLVVDHPKPGAAERWLRVARRLNVPTASVHDLGVAPCHSDLSIDGSIAPGPMGLAGVDFAVLDPNVRRARHDRGGAARLRTIVLISLGGGARRHLAQAIGRAVARRRPDVEVRIAGGFGAGRKVGGGVVMLPAAASLAGEYAMATAAVLAGGVTLYEACAVGLPAVGVAVVPAQRKTIAGLARLGAVIDGDRASARFTSAGAASRVAGMVCDLLDDPARQRRLARSARQLVDGRGVRRVARALGQLEQQSRRDGSLRRATEKGRGIASRRHAA